MLVLEEDLLDLEDLLVLDEGLPCRLEPKISSLGRDTDWSNRTLEVDFERFESLVLMALCEGTDFCVWVVSGRDASRTMLLPSDLDFFLAFSSTLSLARLERVSSGLADLLFDFKASDLL